MVDGNRRTGHQERRGSPTGDDDDRAPKLDGKRPFLARWMSGGLIGAPIPGKQIVEAGLGMTIAEAFEDIFHVGEWLDAVGPGGGEERRDDGPAISADRSR